MPIAPTAVRQDNYHAEKVAVGGVTYVTMHGTLNETFESRKLSAAVRTKKLIINMRDVRRFASWGMSEWMDFLRVTSDCDVYIVECSTYAVSQLNLVTGLLGHSKLVSFYASYRCTNCTADLNTLFLIPRDRSAIRDIPNSYQECPSCGSRAKLEEYPAAFFDTIASRPAFDIDDEALGFMRTNLNYDLSPDLTRFRAYRRVHKDYTYLRLTGNIATLPPDVVARAVDNNTVVDLGGIVYESDQVSAFRTFIQNAKPRVKSLQLLDCPPNFLEAALSPEDLDDKLKVRTFAVTHRCGTCDTLTTQLVDVAQNLEQLVTGELPPARCSSCRSPLVPALTRDEVAILRALPARNRDVALDSYIAKCRNEPPDKLENCLVAAQTIAAAPERKRRNIYLAAGLGGAVLASALIVVLVKLWARPTTQNTIVQEPPIKEHPQFVRPEWIQTDAPASATCRDLIDHYLCVGVSAYRESREDGAAEAADAALEALVHSVALKVSTPYFKDGVLPGYNAVRSKALRDMEQAYASRDNDAKTAAAHADSVRNARRRVVKVLQDTGGAAVPAQRSDWHWEEYESQVATGNEFLVFVKFDVSIDAVRALVDKYGTTSNVLGSTIITAFPALAWQLPKFDGGAQVTKAGGQLASGGVAADHIIVKVGDKRVLDASTFSRFVQDSAPGTLQLSVLANGTEKPVTVKR